MFVPLRLQEVNVVARSTTKQHRIIKVRFHHDGSIFVMFPSFREKEGLVGEATLTEGVRTAALNLAEVGKITSHQVKYSHHPDGKAHFSQDGLVRTEIKRQSVPLSKEQVHLFTVHAEGLNDFGAPRASDTTHKLVFPLHGGPLGIKLVASWCNLRNLGTSGPIQPTSGEMVMRFPNGLVKAGWLISPPHGSPFDSFGLILTPDEMSSLSSEPGSCLTFLGGFDPRNVAIDQTRKTSFLVMKYPCETPEELRKSIGSIDFVRK